MLYCADRGVPSRLALRATNWPSCEPNLRPGLAGALLVKKTPSSIRPCRAASGAQAQTQSAPLFIGGRSRMARNGEAHPRRRHPSARAPAGQRLGAGLRELTPGIP